MFDSLKLSIVPKIGHQCLSRTYTLFMPTCKVNESNS